MLGPEEFRQFLVADVALRRGLADAVTVAEALRRRWEAAPGPGPDVAVLLAEGAGLGPDALAALDAEVAALVQEAEGDPRAALTRRGALSPALSVAATAALKRQAQDGLHAPAGAAARPLRRLPMDRYVDFIPVGEGGMGIVYAALDTELHRIVALKMIRPEGAPPGARVTAISPLEAHPPTSATPHSLPYEELRSRFLQEAWITGGLEHPGIVPVHELGATPGGIPYYTMRFLESQRTLAAALRAAKDEPIHARLLLLEPFVKLCDTVAYAHSKGVLHRDLKPENVALGRFGEVILLDWGLAKLLDARRSDGVGPVDGVWQEEIRRFREAEDLKTVAGMLGTPGYMAPEAALGASDRVDARSDVYSLGVILFEILTGRLPHPARDLRAYLTALAQQEAPGAQSIDPAVPASLSDLCLSALSRDPAARPVGAATMADAVRRWQATSAVDQEVAAGLREASQALERAARATGAARTPEMDQAAAALAQVKARRPGDPTAEAQHRRLALLREEAEAEREREALRRARRRAGARAAVAVLLLAAVAYGVVEGKAWWGRRQAERDAARRLEQAAVLLHGVETAPDAPAALALLERLKKEHPASEVESEAGWVLGTRLVGWERDERAEATWAETWVRSPTSRFGQRAALALGRALWRKGRLTEAFETADALLRLTRDDEVRASAHLLAAEVAWGLGRRDAASLLAGALALKAHLSPEDRLRIQRLEPLLEVFRPSEAAEGIGPAKFAVGRFRRGGLHVAILSADGSRAVLRALDKTGRADAPALEWECAGLASSLWKVNLDGDDVDEVLQIDAAEVPVDEARRRTEKLRIWDVTGDEPRVLSETRIPCAAYRVATGDLDGDGDVDLLLGLRYPGYGVRVLWNDGSGGLTLDAPASLETLNVDRNNVYDVAVGDVTGDGRDDLVFACDEWLYFDLRIFRQTETPGAFVEVPVVGNGSSEKLGRVSSCALLPRADRHDVAFGLSGYQRSEIGTELDGFLPQGLHVASFDGAAQVMRVTPQEPGRRLRLSLEDAADGTVTNLGTNGLAVVRGPGERRYLVSQGTTHRGRPVQRGWLALRPLDALGEPPFLLERPANSDGLEAADLDGDGVDDLAFTTSDGVLHILRGQSSIPFVGRDPAPQPEERDHRTAALDVAGRLLGIGFHELALEYYAALERSAPDPSSERAAFEGTLRALERLGRYEDCIERLDQRTELDSAKGRADLIRRIQYLDWMQRFTEAAEAHRTLTGLGGPIDGDAFLLADRAAELAPWRVVEPRPLPPVAAWSPSDPGCFRLRGESVEVRTSAGRQAALWLPVACAGESFELTFRLRLEELGKGHALQVGFLDNGDRALNAHGPYVQFMGGDDRPIGVDLSANNGVPPPAGSAPPLEIMQLEAGVPYHVLLAWDERGRRLGVTVRRDSEHGAHVLSRQKLVRAGDWRGRWQLAIQVFGEGWPGETHAHLENLTLRQPREAGSLQAAHR